MIRGLSPKTPRALVASPDTSATRTPSDTEPRAEKGDGDSGETPKPEWGPREYRIALVEMVMRGDATGAAAIDQAYRRTPDASTAENALRCEAFSEYIRIIEAKNGEIAKLRSLANQNPKSAGVS